MATKQDVENLLAAYRQAELHVLRLLAETAETALGTRDWYEQQATHLRILIAEAQALLRDAQPSQRELDSLYATGFRDGVAETATAQAAAASIPAVAATATETTQALTAAGLVFLRTTDDAYRRVTKAAIGNQIMSGQSRAQRMQTLLDSYARAGITSYVDRAGHRWGIDTYAEMALRTGLNRAQNEGRISGYLASGNEAWQIPVGINEADLTPYVLEAFAGEHVLVSGPARSGKSTMLAAIHQMLVQSPNTKILVGAPRRSPLCQMLPGVMSPEQLVDVVETQSAAPEPCIVLIDDAHLVADDSQVLARVLALPDSPLLFIVAGRNNDLRTLYSHWTGQIRKSRLGVLLVPDADYDGDLLGVRLPRHPAATVNKGTLKYSLTYRTIKQPLSGDVLEVVTSARSCPDATWDGTAKVVPHSPALTSIDAKCGWTITLKTLPQEEPVTVTAKFPATEAAISNQANLQTWLQNQQQATDKALNNDAVTSTAYSLQRLQTMRIKIPPRVKEGSAIPVTILGTWPGGENEMTPIYTTPFSSNPTSILTDITGGKLENVRLTDRCSGAVSITPDGHDVSALHPASCSIGAEIGNYQVQESPITIVAGGS